MLGCPAALLLCTAVATAGPPACLSDLTGDGVVNVDDLLLLLNAWGPGNGPPDINGNGNVDVDDLLLLVNAWGPCIPPGPVAAELAGMTLSVYPFFDHAISFNKGVPIQLALDPFLHPEFAGKSVKIYVVADRSAAQWAADAQLIDVRSAGPQIVTFAGVDLQSNIFTIDPGTLNAAAGTGVGIGYDVVIDADQNGLLGPGDMIDGADGAGFYVVHDLTQSGPLPVSSVNYSGGSFLGQRTYYPTGIAGMGQLPLVVISHGNGMMYTWYDYLESHLASYGYVVMSHENNTMPGSESASVTTLTNTDYLLGHLATIAGGVLNAHVDSHKIVWIGHSRGGEGVVRAYDKLFDGTASPANFGINDIKLVCAIAPTDFLGVNSANPHGAQFHLVYGSADGDVCGCPDSDIADSFNLFERSIGPRASTYIHGASHNDFNCCGANDFSGPAGTAIGGPEAKNVAKAVFLARIKEALENNIAAKDYLWRQWETIHPIGVSANTIVVNDLRDAVATPGDLVIDDFQTQSSKAISSSGGSVTYDVLSLTEDLCNDNNLNYTWLTTDQMNGMVRSTAADTGKCVIFNYNSPDAPSFMEFQVVPALADWSQKTYLSFRAAQGTRHPDTVAILGDLTFTVILRDGSNVTSAINIGAYGGGIEEPYPRTGYGTGAGWQNEYEVIRIRLSDFLANGSGLSLNNIAALRFEFGGPGATARGRVAMDDIMVTAN